MTMDAVDSDELENGASLERRRWQVASVIETIHHEKDFKVVCDGLLRFEFGPLIQTYASAGADGGVDAHFDGPIAGLPGPWIFQYKFRSPLESSSRRRSWLLARYKSSPKRTTEFDKEGVRAGSGYILVTNIPVTAPLVQVLAAEWQQRKAGGTFCVWDPSRLNALIKTHEHLARSWAGAREERCRRAVLHPVWQWLQRAIEVTSEWDTDALWPMRIAPYRSISPVGSFSRNFSAREGLRLVPNVGRLRAVAKDPQFEFARSVAYPRAMEPFGRVCHAVDQLSACILTQVDKLQAEIKERLPELRSLGDTVWSEATRILAFCVLELRWGYPLKRGLHSIQDGKLVINGQTFVWMDQAFPTIEAKLDELVSAVPHGRVEPEVVAARESIVSVLLEWHELLWSAVEFGLDAEPGPKECESRGVER